IFLFFRQGLCWLQTVRCMITSIEVTYQPDGLCATNQAIHLLLTNTKQELLSETRRVKVTMFKGKEI
ncbi:MAG TPA: hypothetical protein PK178_12660, partial [Smithellaceae bacterium]|nr:hypothetical protein [Smithellaceae bacterium]